MPPIEQMAAATFANQTPPAEAVGVLQPLIETIKPVMGTASAIVGGIFGLYLIFIIARLMYERKKVRLLKDIRYDLDKLNQHFNLSTSKERRHIISRFASKFKRHKPPKIKK